MKSAKDQKLKEILHGCENRNRKSQKLLYQEFYAYALSICLRFADHRDEAEEILNDGFLKVFQNIDTFEFDKEFKPWLRKIMINTAINYYHKYKKYKQTETLDNNLQAFSQNEQITGDISYLELIQMVQRLSPQYRTVFNLYVLDGYKHQEIAELLKITEGTSKSNLAKAKKVLQGMLEKFFLNEQDKPIIG